MPTRIRLRRTGRKGQGYFRIVVAHQEMARDGRVVATLGHYNPRTNPATIQVDVAQARAWLDKGATPTDTVRSLLRRAGVLGRGAAGSAVAAPAASPATPPEE
jgi:small subunit ribosomal protein S16